MVRATVKVTAIYHRYNPLKFMKARAAFARFGVLTVMSLKIQVFWDVTLCRLTALI